MGEVLLALMPLINRAIFPIYETNLEQSPIFVGINKPISAAIIWATDDLGGKTCNRCQAREKMLPVPSAGKYVNVAKRATQCQALEPGRLYVRPDWNT